MTRSFLPASGILHSNENFDAANTEMTGADAIAPDETDTLAAAVSEINADEAAIASGNDQIDSAAVAADGLETIAEQVAEANEGDGIDETTAGFIETSVECMLKVARLGVTYKQLGIPSSESFSVRANRAALGKATLEALDISAKKIWASIIDAIKKSIEWVRNFFNKIFGAAERLEKRAGALKASTTGLKGQPTEKTLSNDTLFNAVRLNGNPVKHGDIDSLSGEASKLFNHQKDVTSKYAAVADLSTESGPLPDAAGYGLKAADGGTAKRVTAEGNVSVFVTSRFPGESVVFLAVPKAAGGTVKDAQDFAAKIKAGSVSLADKKEEGKQLPVLSVDEIRQMADSVEKFASIVSGYKANLGEVNSNKSKFVAKLEKFMSSGDGKAEGSTKAEASKLAKANATAFRKLMDEPAASFASHSVRALSASLQYAELSARQYEKS